MKSRKTRARKRPAKPTKSAKAAKRAQKPIELYYWPTPNGWKVSMMLEECRLPYVLRPVNIGKGEQFEPAFLKIAPNNRMPAIVDPQGPDGKPISVFESGAILQYLGRKTGKFYPIDERKRVEVDEWLFWQMAGLGPMAGQNHHFGRYAPEKIPYAVDRYVKETGRLYAVLDRQLHGREYIVDGYSIADIACYPWVQPERQGQDIDDFPNLKRWKEAIAARPATKRAYDLAKSVNVQPSVNDEAARRILFGQDRHTVQG